MQDMANKCPVCLLPRKGGRRCAYHKHQIQRGLSEDFLRKSAAKTLERSQVVRIVCEAVDDARAGEAYKPKRRRKKKVTPRKILTIRGYLTRELCDAVDIGRQTAGW